MGKRARHVLVSFLHHPELNLPQQKQTQPTNQPALKKNSMKSFLKLTTAAVLLAVMCLTATRAQATGSPSLTIAEVYGGGGNASATYLNDFVVIFNHGSSNVDVNGWSVQYASAAGTSWQVAPLATSSKIIPPNSYFLVKMASGGAVGAALPTPDAPVSAINMSGTVGKVALCNVTNALSGIASNGVTIVDFIGFGLTANSWEGSGRAPAPSNTTSDQRANSGCSDSDDNSADFATATPNPRNSASPTHSCGVIAPPTISGVSPSSITTNAGSSVTFTVTLSAGDSPLSYYWYQGTISAPNLIVGQTTASLVLSNVLAANAGNYQVVVSNVSGTATSSGVTLAVNDPAFNSQPNPNQTLVLGSTASFAVAVGGTPTVTYQWYTGSPGSGTLVSNGGRISGATTSKLIITGLTAGDANTYYVVAGNGLGSITSSVITLTVANNGSLAFWDFNGPFDINAPAPASGAGTASLVNGVAGFVSASGTGLPDGNDTDPESLAGNAWGTDLYPAVGASNLTAGVQFNVSTVGAKNVHISYDVRTTSTASKYTRLQYTTNGTTFTNFPVGVSIFTPQASFFETESFDLTGFPGVANNANFGIRLVTEFESTATSGVTNNPNYLGVSSTYQTSGTVTYDVVNFTADAITNGNTPPTISAIPDVTMPDVASTNITVTVGDAETPGSLTVTAFSYNGAIVNASASGTTVTLTPAGTDGTTTVQVSVTDGNGDSTATFFNVTTVPNNEPPTMTGFINTNTLVNVPVAIPFVVGDDHTAASGLNPTATSGNTALVPNGNLVFSGSGTNRTLTITPVAGALGVAPISVVLNDNDVTLPKSTTNKFALVVRPNTNVVLNDYFTYDGSGAVITESAGFWQTHSGTAGQMQVGAGVLTVDSVANSEDVNAPLIGGPFPTNTSGVLYASYTVNFSTLPTAVGAYISHFKDNTTFGFLGRAWASASNAVAGSYRMGIGNSADASAASPQFPLDLAQGSNYTVVTSLVLSNGFSSLWINPTSQQDVHVSNSTSVSSNLVQISTYAFRESNAAGGTAKISNLRVGTSFADVVDVLAISQVGANVVLSWENATLKLQSSPNVNGPYTTLTSATSPYTNAVAGLTTFYRLGH